MKTKLNQFSGLLFLVLTGAICVGCKNGNGQPIQYNHQIHVVGAGIDCDSCHVNVLNGARATIPNIEVCQDCHGDEPPANKPELKKLYDYISAKKKIPWRKIYQVPSHVFFSHRRHAALGKIACETCHGKISERTTPVTEQAFTISMTTCMDCHRKNGVTTDCLFCHR